MSFTDPIADLLTRLRNAQHSRSPECVVPWSRIKQEICDLLKMEGFVSSVSVQGEGKEKMITVVFDTQRPALLLKRVSTPGGRRYVGTTDIRHFLHGASIAILSTSAGLMTSRNAREKKIGGEILCTVA